MIHTPRSLLDRYANIALLREVPCKTGMRLARGFADIGYEEFCLLPNKQLLSLYLGTQTPFHEEEREHFFYVPDVEDMVRLFAETGYYVQQITSDEGRDFALSFKGDERLIQGTGMTLQEACLTCMEAMEG